jgi:hypothetical protein
MINDVRVKVFGWFQDGNDEPHSWYRIGIKGEGDRLFRDLKNNAELDGREKFYIKEVRSKEWKQASKLGKEMA